MIDIHRTDGTLTVGSLATLNYASQRVNAGSADVTITAHVNQALQDLVGADDLRFEVSVTGKKDPVVLEPMGNRGKTACFKATVRGVNAALAHTDFLLGDLYLSGAWGALDRTLDAASVRQSRHRPANARAGAEAATKR